MKKFIDKAKICLNNENGSPSLETLVSIGFSIIVIGGLYSLGSGVWDYLHRMGYENSTELADGRITPIMGYSTND